MYNWVLLLDISRNVALIGIGAYLTTQIPAFRRVLTQSGFNMRDKVTLIVICGFFSAIGNWIGIPVMGSMANTRIVGPVVAGLIGGPIVGIGAGIIGAIPRYFMGGYTMPASVLANVIAGLISGMVYNRYKFNRLDLKTAIATGLVAEIILKILVLAMSQPFAQAWELEKLIGIPTMVGNSIAVGMFIYIIQDVFKEQKKVQAQSIQQAMRMIQQTTQSLRDGLNPETATAIAAVLHMEMKADLVAVMDHHKIIAETPKAISCQQLKQVCFTTQCPIISAPIIVDNQHWGRLKICKRKQELYETEFVQGIADFLGLLLTKYQLQEQKRLLVEAEYRMLKAQINPHFLFNTLGAVRALIRTNPDSARACIKDLSCLLRRALEHSEKMVSLQEEFALARAYLRLEQTRFGNRIQYQELCDERLMYCRVPVFILQPLVENAIRHGLSPKAEGGILTIRVWQQHSQLFIEIEDNGVGIEAEKLIVLNQFNPAINYSSQGSGIGLININQQLKLKFGLDYGLQIHSIVNQLTIVRANLPYQI